MARAMKDSGIEWIGKIPEEWEIHRVSNYFNERRNRNYALQEQNLLSLSYGKIVQKDINTVGGLLPASFNTYNIVEANDIIIRPTDLQNDWRSLRTGLVTQRGIITAAYIALKPNPGVNSAYYHYLLHAYDIVKVFYNMGNGVRQGLNYSEFARLLVFSPPKGIQHAIVDYLNDKCAEIDAPMADVQAQIETLEQYKRSVITEAVTKGLNPNVPMKDSGTAWIDTMPSHWALIPAKYMFHNSDLRRIGDDVLLTSSQKYGIISQTDYMERENAKIVLANKGIEDWKHVEPYDFIISLRSFQGGLEMSETTGCITWHYVVLKALRTIVPKYYKWLFKSQSYITALQRTCNFIRDGQDLRFSNFSQVPLPEPPIEEQQAIASYLDTKCAEIDSIIEGKRQQLSTLEEYKKSIIFEYVMGKREVPTNA